MSQITCCSLYSLSAATSLSLSKIGPPPAAPVAASARKGKGKYYCKTIRENGRLTRDYIGSGPVGDLAATLDTLERRELAAQAEAEARQKTQLQTAEKLVRELCDRTDLLIRASVVAAGFHRHGGEWRCRKHVKSHTE